MDETNTKTLNFFKRELCMKIWLDSFFGIDLPIPVVPVLQNGVLLCKVIEKIYPELLPEFHEGDNLPYYKIKENIYYFLESCTQMGLSELYLFSINDLFHGEINHTKVISCLEKLIQYFKHTGITYIPTLLTPRKLPQEIFTKYYSLDYILSRFSINQSNFFFFFTLFLISIKTIDGNLSKGN